MYPRPWLFYTHYSSFMPLLMPFLTWVFYHYSLPSLHMKTIPVLQDSAQFLLSHNVPSNLSSSDVPMIVDLSSLLVHRSQATLDY